MLFYYFLQKQRHSKTEDSTVYNRNHRVISGKNVKELCVNSIKGATGKRGKEQTKTYNNKCY